MKAYVDADQTNIIVTEYFEPELKRNGVCLILGPIKTWRSRKKKSSVDDSEYLNKRLNSAEVIASAAQEANKPVAVADIGTKFSFLPAFLVSLRIPLPLLAADNKFLFSLGLSVVALQHYFLYFHRGEGIFNKDRIGEFEKFIVDFEQARRQYLEKGVEQLTEKIYAETNGEETSQVVVLYPRAHGNRMIENIIHPHPKLDKIKSGVYKTTAPWLNFSLRRWEYQNPEWVRTSRERITM